MAPQNTEIVIGRHHIFICCFLFFFVFFGRFRGAQNKTKKKKGTVASDKTMERDIFNENPFFFIILFGSLFQGRGVWGGGEDQLSEEIFF
jgi:hypothetical protein